MENLTYTTPAEVIAALSVFKKAVRHYKKLLYLRQEKLSAAAYKSPSFNGLGNGRNKYRKDNIAEALASIEELDKTIGSISGSLAENYREVMGIIENNIDDYNQRIILQRYYIGGLTWPEVSNKTGFEASYCRRLHRKAIDILVEKGVKRNEE